MAKHAGQKLKKGVQWAPKLKNWKKPRGKIIKMYVRIRDPKLKKGKSPRRQRFAGSKISVSTTCRGVFQGSPFAASWHN
jgi:hypothetical protein